MRTWSIILMLAALGFVLGVAGIVRALPLATVAERMGSKKEPLVDTEELARSIENATHNPTWSALLLTVLVHESGLAARIARGEYKDYEGDSYHAHGILLHRAWGLGQLHSNTLNQSVWGSTDVATQVFEVHKALRRAFYTCLHGHLAPDWPARTINAYAGRPCDDIYWPGLSARLITFRKVETLLNVK